jgi:predicted NBD/HSP70 family sugar kinase
MILCVDTGGTKTLVAEFGSNGHPYRIHRFATPHNPDAYIKKLSTLITQQYNLLEVEAISIGVPGEVRHGQLLWCVNLPWKNFDIVHQLGAALRYVRPIYIDNDANMGAIGEAYALHPLPHSALYLTVSTGINGCLVVDGAIQPGIDHSEMGMMVVEYKGNIIKWENLASGRALYESTGQFARDITDPVIWHDVAHKLSRGLLDIIPILQPDCIIIGGSIGTYFERFSADLKSILDRDLYAHLDRPRLLKAHHPEEAVIYGGYHYARHARVAH